MNRKRFQLRIDAKVEELRRERKSLEEQITDLDTKIERLNSVRDDPDFDFLLDVLVEPTAKVGKKKVPESWPKGNQFQKILKLFQSNNNAWTATGEVAAKIGLPAYTVRKLTYARYPDYIERREKDKTIEIRMRNL